MSATDVSTVRPPAVDHRVLGRERALFATDELVGAGLPLWLPDGAAIRRQLEALVIELEDAAGYRRVVSPVLGKRELYERSGHWQHFHDDMFPPMDVGGDQLVLRPSNCPHHILIYAAEHRSYRDLPVRLAELGTQFRAERSGVLGGLSRVRAMTLNDGHLFVAPEQVEAEVTGILAMIRRAYAVLGIDDHRLRLSLHGPRGSYADAGRRPDAERALRSALAHAGADYDEEPDEAAFYGPKIDVQVRDAGERELTLSTVQVDFHLPEVFDLSYQATDGSRRRPVIIHRSAMSTMERLVAHLVERYAGRFPVWLAPVQLAVLPVDDDHRDAAGDVAARAAEAGLRVEVVDARRSLGARVRDAHQRGVPFAGVIGDREVGDGTLSLRRRDGHRIDPLPSANAIDLVADLAARRARAFDDLPR